MGSGLVCCLKSNDSGAMGKLNCVQKVGVPGASPSCTGRFLLLFGDLLHGMPREGLHVAYQVDEGSWPSLSVHWWPLEVLS